MGAVMTTANERARALRLAGEILWEMLARDDVPEDLRHQARVALRHYPDSTGLKQMIGGSHTRFPISDGYPQKMPSKGM